MGNRWAACGLLALWMMLWSSLALADTGGSMGGGSWGGGGSSRRSGGGYSSSSSSSSSSWSRSSGWGGSSSSSRPSRSYDYGSRDYSSSGGNYSYSSGSTGSTDPLTMLWFAGAFGVLLVGIVRLANRDSQPVYDPNAYSYADTSTFNSADVTVLRIAIDGRARKFVQTELKRIAQTADTKTDAGRTTMLREVALMLRRLRDAWVYGGAVNEPMQWINTAKPVFDKHVDNARARFTEEVIRNADGTITKRDAAEYNARGDEGAGLILVTLVIAARRELFTVQRIGDGDDLRQALEGASQLTPDNLVAIEVIWQPAEDGDRLTSMELEAKYPRPDLIPIQNALVGKTFCEYCTGPFPAELVSCPHCGAPAPGRKVA